MPADGFSVLQLSSVARVKIVISPADEGTQEYVHLVVPWAGCQVCPPSTETSTPATAPPPVSELVPETVTACPVIKAAPFSGAVMTEVGAIVSVDAVAVTRPGARVCG